MGTIKGIPAQAEALFERLLDEPEIDPAKLRGQLDRYVETFVHATDENRSIDAEQAGEIAGACHRLLDLIRAEAPPLERRIIQAAVRYFVIDDDADDDMTLGGLDDDIGVVNAVLRHLGRGELAVTVD